MPPLHFYLKYDPPPPPRRHLQPTTGAQDILHSNKYSKHSNKQTKTLPHYPPNSEAPSHPPPRLKTFCIQNKQRQTWQKFQLSTKLGGTSNPPLGLNTFCIQNKHYPPKKHYPPNSEAPSHPPPRLKTFCIQNKQRQTWQKFQLYKDPSPLSTKLGGTQPPTTRHFAFKTNMANISIADQSLRT